MQAYRPERIVVEKGCEGLAMTRRILERLPGLPVEICDDLDPAIRALGREADPVSEGKKCLIISKYSGAFLKKCPGTQGFVCCNYLVLNAATGCPLDCSYCILQEYLFNNPALRIFANTDAMFAQLKEWLAKSQGRDLRIGTGELTDSLALDPITGFSRELVTFFGRQDRAVLELKTKTDHVEDLLDLPHHGRTVVAWSVNPDHLIESHEEGSASLKDRLSAARRCIAAGYRIAFHFDPILFDLGWETSYLDLVDQVFSSISVESVSWVSLGGLRFPQSLKRIIGTRFPQSRLMAGEMVPCPDNKLRYIRPIRVQGYREMVRRIRTHGPEVPVYLCMESREVWEAVFGNGPAGVRNLAGIF
ncbi:MAG: spore photoproduct lyase family protein [bacterium]